MNLAFAALVYLSFAAFLGWGILLAHNGSYWLLVAGAAVYTSMLYLIGCRTPHQQ